MHNFVSKCLLEIGVEKSKVYNFVIDIMCIFVVMATRFKFKRDLNEVLKELVAVAPGQMLKAEDLVCTLKERNPGIKCMDREKILRATSQLFKQKLEYHGKKKE